MAKVFRAVRMTAAGTCGCAKCKPTEPTVSPETLARELVASMQALGLKEPIRAHSGAPVAPSLRSALATKPAELTLEARLRSAVSKPIGEAPVLPSISDAPASVGAPPSLRSAIASSPAAPQPTTPAASGATGFEAPSLTAAITKEK